MGTKANLTIDAAVLSAFRGANAEADGSDAVYRLSLTVAGSSVTLSSSASAPAGRRLEESFAELSASGEPGMYLLRGASGGRWLLVSYVPEATHPKAKMLAAAARDDLRRALSGEGARLAPDYPVTEADGLTFAAVRDQEAAARAARAA